MVASSYKHMKIALVHDYIKEYGGAERVLRTLTEIYPKAPIYTAFRVKDSTADKEFKGKEIKESFLSPLLKIDNFYSPLRFLTPLIWKSMNLSQYDVVIASSGWYITRGFRVGPKTKVICYCHTPPRWLYGYETSVGFTKYWPVKVYSAIVGHFMRMYDFNSAQTVSAWIANSKNVQGRIEKFYRKNSKVIYPPVDVETIIKETGKLRKASGPKGLKPRGDDYYLIVSRLVGAKGLEEAAKAAKRHKFKLKIAGEARGFSDVEKRLKNLSGGNVELLGRVGDKELYKLYGQARGFIALARDEDFGMTPVEAMAAGTPVIAFNGGGFRESVVDGVTGILIDDTDEGTIGKAVKRLEGKKWDKEKLRKQARKFSKETFKEKMRKFIKK